MKKILILMIISTIKSGISNLDRKNTIPYHEFNWIKEDNYSIDVAFTNTPSAQRCCLYNGTNYCLGACTLDSGTNIISCRFYGGNCEADADNPATKFYYGVYCSDIECGTGGTLTDNEFAEVTVAVKSHMFLKVHLSLIIFFAFFLF